MNLLLIGFTKDALHLTGLLDTERCRIVHSADCESAIEKLLESDAGYNRIVLRARPEELEGTAAFVAKVRAMGKHFPIDVVISGAELAGLSCSEAVPRFNPSREETRRGFAGRGDVVIEYHAPCRPIG